MIYWILGIVGCILGFLAVYISETRAEQRRKHRARLCECGHALRVHVPGAKCFGSNDCRCSDFSGTE
jgi:hypothetical protein